MDDIGWRIELWHLVDGTRQTGSFTVCTQKTGLSTKKWSSCCEKFPRKGKKSWKLRNEVSTSWKWFLALRTRSVEPSAVHMETGWGQRARVYISKNGENLGGIQPEKRNLHVNFWTHFIFACFEILDAFLLLQIRNETMHVQKREACKCEMYVCLVDLGPSQKKRLVVLGW